jgi:GT2 family glycosyltransferase
VVSSLSVIILNWNQTATTLACLRGIERWRQLEPRVWVVDNASTDPVREQIRSAHPKARLVEASRNLGFGGGNNLALREVGDHDVLLLNNDASIAEDDLMKLRRTLESHPAAAIVGPAIFESADPTRLLAAGGRDISTHVATHCRSIEQWRRAAESSQPLDVDYIPGAAALLRGSALARVGLLDEHYFFGGEMADWCRRAKRAGFRILLDPTSRAYHDTSLSTEARLSLYPYYVLRNRFLYVRRFRRSALPLFLCGWSAFGLFAACRAATLGRPHDATLLLRALRDGLLNRSGPIGESRSD